MSIKQRVSLAKETYSRWSDHSAPRLGASVAFYSILSFAPLLLLVTAVVAFVFGHESAQGAIVNEAKQLIGDRGADTVNTLLKNAQKPASGVFATVIAFITLLFGASGVFTELRDALNIMWDAPKEQASGVMAMIKQRLFSFGMVLSVGFLLLVSLILSTAFTYLGRGFGHVLPMPPFVLEALNFIVSFAAISALFALMFKYVPNVKVPWRDVIVGAIGTALLFVIGKFLLGIYLAKAGVGSPYGAAGSLVAVVVWIYYSAQIFFFGAEFTRVYADAQHPRTGREPEPAPQGVSADTKRVVPRASQQPASETAAAPLRAAAAAAGSSSPRAGPVALEQPSRTVTPRQATAPALSTATARPAARNEFARSAPVEITKPRLLISLGLGFVLGRVTAGIQNHRERR